MSSITPLPPLSQLSPGSIGVMHGQVPPTAWFNPFRDQLFAEALKSAELMPTDSGSHGEDPVIGLSRLMQWTEGETYKYLITQYQVLPLRGGSRVHLSNQVLDYFAQFNAGFKLGGWIPVQKIGPGIVFAHFLPNVPKPELPAFFQSHCLVDYPTYARLYSEFLQYDEGAIRKEYGLTLVKEDFAAVSAQKPRIHAIADILLRLSHKNGPDQKKLSELKDLPSEPGDETPPMHMLIGKVNPEYDVWIQAKLSERKDDVSYQLGIVSAPLSVIDPRELEYGPQERELNIPAARRKWMADNQILPVFVEGSFVACASPRFADTAMQHRLTENLHTLDVFCVLCTEKALHWVLNERRRETSAEGTMEIIRGTEEVVMGSPEAVDIDASIDLQNNDSTKDFVKRVIANAIDMGASDIHFEMTGSNCRIRYRIDGLLRDMYKPFRAEIAPYLNRVVKATAGMNIAETRIPLDGRVRVGFKNRGIDLRIATCPVEAGSGMNTNDYEKCVIRILDSGTAPTRLEEIIWNLDQRELMKRMIDAPYGTIVVTGPTGSGKSTTIYTLLNELNTPDINIMTAENPVERKLAGVNQTMVTEQTTFALALRSFLRMDPDVILVGEIRDKETAGLSIQASQTGHLVLTTIHANNAVGVIGRYRQFGVDSHDIASTVLLVTAQRLIRQLCIRCRTRVRLSALEKAQFSCKSVSSALTENDFVYAHRGCAFCNNSGYKGRVAVMEMIDIDEEVRTAIMENEKEAQIQALATRHGFKPLHNLGLEAVARGATDFSAIAELVASISFSEK